MKIEGMPGELWRGIVRPVSAVGAAVAAIRANTLDGALLDISVHAA